MAVSSTGLCRTNSYPLRPTPSLKERSEGATFTVPGIGQQREMVNVSGRNECGEEGGLELGEMTVQSKVVLCGEMGGDLRPNLFQPFCEQIYRGNPNEGNRKLLSLKRLIMLSLPWSASCAVRSDQLIMYYMYVCV